MFLYTDEPSIFGETLLTRRSTGGSNNGVEQRIYIEANPMIGNSDSSDSVNSFDSDNNEDGMSGNASDGKDYLSSFQSSLINMANFVSLFTYPWSLFIFHSLLVSGNLFLQIFHLFI